MPEAAGKLILGLDPGLRSTGYAFLEDASLPRFLEGGVIATSQSLTMEKRLWQIYEGLGKVLDAFRPAVMVVEGLFTDYKAPAAAVLMGHARGASLLAAAARGVPVLDYSPARVKKALTGNGNASKEQVQKMLQNVLALPELPKPDHLADALAVAYCHLGQARQRETMAGVERID